MHLGNPSKDITTQIMSELVKVTNYKIKEQKSTVFILNNIKGK